MKKTLLLVSAMFCMAFSSFATVHMVTVADFSFSPSSMTITLGDTVEWMWTGPSTHTTTSLATIPAGAVAWSHTLNASSASFTYVPTVVGVYHYQCNIHPSLMQGSFTVASSTSAPNLATGQEILFPNPATSNVQLRFPDESASTVAVYDIAGRQMLYGQFQSTDANLNVSALPQGRYIVHIARGYGYYKHELLILH